jgi:excisionase family DNA binding protein
MGQFERRYTSEEVAKIYNVKATTVTRWVREGKITALNIGGGRTGPYAFRPSDLFDFEHRTETGWRPS